MLKFLIVLSMITPAVFAQTIKQEPAGCLAATAQSNGPCKLTYPNGNTLATLADGSTWATIHKFQDFRFQVGPGMQNVKGTFHTRILTAIPQEIDIVQAPQSGMLNVEGDCQSRTYVIDGAVATDVNGALSEDLGGENFARRVTPDSPMEALFAAVCAKP